MGERDDEGPVPGAAPSDANLAAYVAETCAELRTLCRAAPFRTLNYLLDQVRAEAERVARLPGDEEAP